ncbi:hypothetical protein [Streptomyces sp. NPDC059928]|uniref:hypothetical protein n=1 Tax=unclassified Streptomyces TaxID=2593676 RepID=UPI003658246F
MTTDAPQPGPTWPKDTRTGRYDWEKARGLIHAFDESKPLASWAEDPRCAVGPEALRTRLALGWAPEEALTRAKHERPTLTFTYNERTLTLRGWADQSGIKYHTLYGRITRQGLTFEQALDKGPDGAHYTVPVTAFGETKALYRWGVDPRANATAGTIRKRIKAGWNPQLAITEEPEHRSTLGTGHPHHAFGQRMSIPDWGRLSAIPEELIRGQMDRHGLPLEAALQSLGWTPSASALSTSVLTVTLDRLHPGDVVVAADTSTGSATVRRTHRVGPTPPLPSWPAPSPALPPSPSARKATSR